MAKVKRKLLSVLLAALLILTYQVILMDKFYPITLVGDQNLSFLTQNDATGKIDAKFKERSKQKIAFNYPQQTFTIDLATASASIDYSVVDEVFTVQHTGTFLDILKNQLKILISPKKVSPPVSLKIEKQVAAIAKQVEKNPKDAQLLYSEAVTDEGSASANIQIKESEDGLQVEKSNLETGVKEYLLSGKYQMNLPVKSTSPKIATEHVKRAKKALEDSLKMGVKLKFKGSVWVIDTKQLLTLLDLTSGENLLLDKDKTYIYLNKIASEIDQDVQEGLFEFNPSTKRVIAFKPSQEGRKLDLDSAYSLLTQTFADSKRPRNIDLPVTVIKPKIQTSDVNSLGIKELIGRGISHFRGSIPNRIYNVNLTASKINGVLVPPGEIFSFNQTVGDITAQTGFKQAYVIKSGRTVLDDGGGVCQDSTTLFRAVLNAGLPVVKRTAHAYRVGYYEQGFSAGLDATVFYPSVDFQFKNDTPAHILIQAYTLGLTLYVDLYGTSDGRVSTVSKSVVTDQTPPPPELRQDDPTLPKGEVKQVDWSAWGAKVSFTRTVTRGGQELIKETWRSSYRPWQAVYLVGTKEN